MREPLLRLPQHPGTLLRVPKVVLIRHALSVWNVEGRWQGHADPALADEGEAQARHAAASLGPVDLVVTSDLRRARRTAAILAPGVAHLTDALLRELDVGAWSGRTRAEIERVWQAELALFEAGKLEAPPGGESRSAFEGRVRAAAARVCELAREAGATRTLVVTHGGVLRALARMQACGDRPVGHLGGYEAEVKKGDLVVGQPVDLLSAAAPRPRAGDRTSL